MSVRIHNDQAAGVNSPQVSGTGQSAATHSSPGKTGVSGVSSESGGDRVDISTVSESISSGISAQNLAHASHIAQIKAAYANGNYAVNSTEVSRALIGNAISGTVASGKA